MNIQTLRAYLKQCQSLFSEKAFKSLKLSLIVDSNSDISNLNPTYLTVENNYVCLQLCEHTSLKTLNAYTLMSECLRSEINNRENDKLIIKAGTELFELDNAFLNSNNNCFELFFKIFNN